MALWVVRAGRHGEQQETALRESVVCHGWNEVPDYSACRTKDDLRDLYQRIYPDASEKSVLVNVGQLWRFARGIQKGDLVALPLKTQAAFAFGRVSGEYQYRNVAPNVMHTRAVTWIKTAVPRSTLPADILLSIGSMLTVFEVKREDAEGRVSRLLASPTLLPAAVSEDAEFVEGSDEEIDLDVASRDKITKAIQARFTRHDLTRLVDAVLRAQGYKTAVSPAGPDGGVDILAGSGPLGFDAPRLCVQVKSGGSAEGQATYNELLGVVSKFGAGQGLLVSWGGFTNAVERDARKAFFTIRLWDQGDLVDAVLRHYDALDSEIRAELPLKRIWVLVNEDAD